jgi:hypothetical protein
MYFLVIEQFRGIHQIFIDAYATDIMKAGEGDRRPVYL